MATKDEVRAMMDKCADDEPLFLLRARDLFAPATIGAWVAQAMTSRLLVPPGKIKEAHDCAGRMLDWQIQNGAKVPD